MHTGYEPMQTPTQMDTLTYENEIKHIFSLKYELVLKGDGHTYKHTKKYFVEIQGLAIRVIQVIRVIWVIRVIQSIRVIRGIRVIRI